MYQPPQQVPSAYRAPYQGAYDPINQGSTLSPIQESPYSYQSQFPSASATPATPRQPSTEQLLRYDGRGDYEWISRGGSDDSDNDQRQQHLQQADDADEPAARRKPITWPRGIKTGLFVVAAVLILNAAVTLWATLAFSVHGGLGTLHKGSCHSIEKIGFGIHIVINIIGTLLLGASNFAMQCLTSPTRKEVDAQHARRNWLEVGVLSMRNLKAIDRNRIWLWFFLGFSSFPIHLMFNSAVFVTLTANQYTVAAVTPEFIDGGAWELPKNTTEQIEILKQMQDNATSYERLTPEECIREYSVDFVSTRRHVVVVTALGASEHDGNALIATMDWEYRKIQNSWVCYPTVDDDLRLHPFPIDQGDCTPEEALAQEAMWTADEEVRFCLSQRVPDVCRLQFSLPIMIIVITCNTVKLVCILMTLMHHHTTLITMGDAVDTYLRRPDQTTKGMCSMTMEDFKKGVWLLSPEPRMWAYRRHWRFKAAGKTRWISTNVFGFFTAAILALILWIAINNTTTNPDIHTWWSLGFGSVKAASLVRWAKPMTGTGGLLRNVLLANLPQLLISTMYLGYNQAFTCMAFASEYTKYFSRQLPLRVTRPQGQQQSSYFLTLPFRYIVPLMILSTTMHFVLSQGFFLVAIDVFDLEGNMDTDKTIMSVGFSISALVVLVALCGVIVLAAFLSGFRRFPKGMPLVGPCSAAISAACHVADHEDGAVVAEGKVQWGVVDLRNRVGHLSFSSGMVGKPIPGFYYAGQGTGRDLQTD